MQILPHAQLQSHEFGCVLDGLIFKKLYLFMRQLCPSLKDKIQRY